MSFCGTELARRIERAERGLIEECTAAVAKDAANDAFLLPFAGGVAAFSGAASPLTKVAGLGFAGVPALGELERVETEFRARGAAVQVELSTLAEPAIAALLTARGYALVGFENVLGRPLSPREEGADVPGLAITRAGAEELELWIDVMATSFASPDSQGVPSHESFPREAIERAIRATSAASGLVRSIARRNGAPAGGASMRLADGIAQLCGAATLPAHRRRGIQSALLRHRFQEAARAGCTLAIVTTLPGSKSQQNVQAQGFELLYARAILRREPRGLAGVDAGC